MGKEKIKLQVEDLEERIAPSLITDVLGKAGSPGLPGNDHGPEAATGPLSGPGSEHENAVTNSDVIEPA